MVLTVSLFIIIARHLKGTVSVSQSLIRILEGNGRDIIPGSHELAHMVYSHLLLYLWISDGISRIRVTELIINYLVIFVIANFISVQ